MSSDPSHTQRFAAILVKNGVDTNLGTVSIDGKGIMRPEHVEAGPDADKLHNLIDEMNGTQVMHVDVPSREGAPEFTLTSAIIERSDPEFLPALKDQALTYYGIELRAP